MSRAEYPYLRPIATRWADNDIYGHVNNVEYLAFFDTTINAYLIERGGLDIHGGESIGLCVESHCSYHRPLAFPDELEGALRVGTLGRSSVRYELAIFKAGTEAPAAEGWFVHVFVDRLSRASIPIADPLRSALRGLIVEGA
jgi:acyl-CoA thioester hydrolase